MRIFKRTRFAIVAGLLGAALIMGAPLTSEADPGGKWWAGGKGKGNGNGHGKKRAQVERREEYRGSSRRSSGRRDVRVERDVRVDSRVVQGAPVRSYSREYSRPVTRYRGTPTYRTSYSAPVWGGSRHYTGKRHYRTYGTVPVYRDYVSVRVHNYYQPVYGWRYYCPPAYYYPTHVVYVRPVRFFVAADFVIGGVGISASYVDPGPVYGCNFCDARFGDYGAYAYHVEHRCSHAPHGYRVVAEEWDRRYSNDWDDDHVGDRRYEEYERDYEDRW